MLADWSSLVASRAPGHDHSAACTAHPTAWHRNASRAIPDVRRPECLAGLEQTGTYDATRGQTTYGRTVLSGLWVFAHDIVCWDALVRSSERK
jgi:hypothetical protein